jgi:hypothetical protein
MTGPGDEMAAGAAGRGRLRASHADREQVIGTLKAAFVQGMLDKDEFDLRVGQAFASRTYADLAAVTADLPAGLPAAPPPTPARAQDQQPVVRFGPTIMAVSALYAGVWAFALLGPGWDTDNIAADMPLLVLTFVEVVILIVAGIDKLASRHRERSGECSSQRRLFPMPLEMGSAGRAQGRLCHRCEQRRLQRADRITDAERAPAQVEPEDSEVAYGQEADPNLGRPESQPLHRALREVCRRNRPR